jgi:hypothetical protein
MEKRYISCAANIVTVTKMLANPKRSAGEDIGMDL